MIHLMSEKQGIEIDYCLKCRIIWLDSGGLEKISERTYSIENQPDQPLRGNNHDFHGYNKDGRKRNYISELFD